MELRAAEAVLLSGDLPLHPKPRPLYRVVVTPTRLTYVPLDGKAAGSAHVPGPAHARSERNSVTSLFGSVTSYSVSSPDLQSTEFSSEGGALNFSDVIGCACQKGQLGIPVGNSSDLGEAAPSGGKGAAYLCLYAYPHRRKFLSRQSSRRRVTVTLTFDRRGSFADNHAEALLWKSVVDSLLRGQAEVNSGLPPSDVSLRRGSAGAGGVEAPQYPAGAPQYLVLVNPFSGPGEALQIYRERVLPMFAEAGLRHHMIVTKQAGYARTYVRTIVLADWAGIIIVSGDGLIHETVNGLMERADWTRAIQTPIGALPGGSGNALCAAMLHRAGESDVDNMIPHSTFLLLKHVLIPMDLLAIDVRPLGGEKSTGGQVGGPGRLYGFLAVGWGFISDVDIESERWRRLGGARFTVGAVIKVVSLHRYRAQLSFLPADPNYKPKWPDQSQLSVRPPLTNQKASSSSVMANQEQEQAQTRNGSVQAADAQSASSSKRVSAELNGFADIGNNRLSKILQNPQAATPTPPVSDSTPQTKFLPPSLDDPVPPNWVTVETDFLTVFASLHTHMSAGLVVAPKARSNDGLLHLMMVRAGISRWHFAQLLNAMEDHVPREIKARNSVKFQAQTSEEFPAGNSTSSSSSPPQREDSKSAEQWNCSPWAEIVPVRAFRLVPLTSGGMMAVDGERVDGGGGLQAEVLPGVARAMAMYERGADAMEQN